MRRTLMAGAAAAAAWTLAAAIVFVTLAPRGFRPHVAGAQVERFGAYFVTGLAFALAYPERLRVVALGVTAGAVSLELLQLIAPGRDAGVPDALAKCLGGVAAVVAVGAVRASLRLKAGAR